MLTQKKIEFSVTKLSFDTRLCIKPGTQERGAECGERGEWVECYIPRNICKHQGMFQKIPGNLNFNLFLEILLVFLSNFTVKLVWGGAGVSKNSK